MRPIRGLPAGCRPAPRKPPGCVRHSAARIASAGSARLRNRGCGRRQWAGQQAAVSECKQARRRAITEAESFGPPFSLRAANGCRRRVGSAASVGEQCETPLGIRGTTRRIAGGHPLFRRTLIASPQRRRRAADKPRRRCGGPCQADLWRRGQVWAALCGTAR